jgi:hypothetical protein
MKSETVEILDERRIGEIENKDPTLGRAPDRITGACDSIDRTRVHIDMPIAAIAERRIRREQREQRRRNEKSLHTVSPLVKNHLG